jgi:hypothetical protein
MERAEEEAFWATGANAVADAIRVAAMAIFILNGVFCFFRPNVKGGGKKIVRPFCAFYFFVFWLFGKRNLSSSK